MKTKTKKFKNVLIKDRESLSLEKRLLDARLKLKHDRKDYLISKAWSKDTFYVRNFSIYSDNNIAKTEIKPIELFPKLKVPGLKKSFLSPSERLNPDRYKENKNSIKSKEPECSNYAPLNYVGRKQKYIMGGTKTVFDTVESKDFDYYNAYGVKVNEKLDGFAKRVLGYPKQISKRFKFKPDEHSKYFVKPPWFFLNMFKKPKLRKVNLRLEENTYL